MTLGSQILHLFKRGWKPADDDLRMRGFKAGYECAVEDIAHFVDTGHCLWTREDGVTEDAPEQAGERAMGGEG